MTPSTERTCPSCGRGVSGRSRFCVGCGADLAAVVAPPAAAPAAAPAVPTDAVVPAVVTATATAAAVTAPASSASVPAGPDTNLVRALRRASRSNPIMAGFTAALVAALLVATLTALLGALFWFAHTRNGCAADASFANRACTETAGADGFLANWNAVIWPFHGAGVVVSAADGSSLSMRIPLGVGMLLTGIALFIAGRVTVRLLPPRLPRDIALRAAVIAVSYALIMVVVGAAITARGGGYSVGPDYGLLVVWALVIGFAGSALGIARRLFGPTVPAVPQAMFSARYPRADALLGPALVAAAFALGMSAVLGMIAMATHQTDTTNILHAAFVDLTTRQLPDSPIGAIASLVLIVLALPSVATWVLAYAMAIPSVGVGTPSGAGDFGLGLGDHDAWFWAVIAVPILASMLAGYGATRRRRAGSVEGALAEGGLGGLVWAALVYLAIVLLDGSGTLTGGSFGITGTSQSVPFGPGLQNSFLALLLYGPVGGAVGGYVSLLTYRTSISLPIVRRWNIARVGPPIIREERRCPACGRAAAEDARFCSGCGITLPERGS